MGWSGFDLRQLAPTLWWWARRVQPDAGLFHQGHQRSPAWLRCGYFLSSFLFFAVPETQLSPLSLSVPHRAPSTSEQRALFPQRRAGIRPTRRADRSRGRGDHRPIRAPRPPTTQQRKRSNSRAAAGGCCGSKANSVPASPVH